MVAMKYPVASSTVRFFWNTFAGSTGASITQSGLATTDIEIFKEGSMTQRASDNGFSLIDTDGIDLDGITGFHGIAIDLSDNSDSGFYAVGSRYVVVVSSITVDSQTVSFIAGEFEITSATRRLAGTALPDAASDAAGGLPISDAGGLDMDAILADTNEIQGDLANGGRLDLIFDATLADTNELQTDWVNGGRLDLLLDATLADTNELQTDWANGGRLDLIVDATLNDTFELQQDWTDGGRLDLVLTAVKAKTDNLPASPAAVGDIPTTAQINAEVDAALADYDGPTRTEATADKDEILSAFQEYADDLSNLYSDNGTVSDASATTMQFDTDLGLTFDDRYADQILKFNDGNLEGCTRPISGSSTVGGKTRLTFDEAWQEAPDNGSAFSIMVSHVHPVSQIQSGLATSAEIAALVATLQGTVLAQGTIGATGNNATHLHLAGLTYGDDEINDQLLVIQDVSTGEYHARWMEDWADTGDLATVATLPFTPQSSTDKFWLLPIRRDVAAEIGDVELPEGTEVKVGEFTSAALAQFAAQGRVTLLMLTLDGNALTGPIIRGNAYNNEYNNSIQFSSSAWPDLDDVASVSLNARENVPRVPNTFQIPGTVVAPTGTKVIRFERTSAETVAYKPGHYLFEVTVTFNGDPAQTITLIKDATLTVKENFA